MQKRKKNNSAVEMRTSHLAVAEAARRGLKLLLNLVIKSDFYNFKDIERMWFRKRVQNISLFPSRLLTEPTTSSFSMLAAADIFTAVLSLLLQLVSLRIVST